MDERLNSGWSFCKLPLGSQYEDLLDVEWSRVDLPHDWLISQQDLYQSNDGWYTRTLHIETLADSFYMLRFEGVYMDCSVIINGEKACDHTYGYTTFDCHMTPFLHEGENSIHVHVRHPAPNTRWYSGAGIFRDVTLHLLQNVHIAMDGLYVQVDGDAGTVQIETEIERFVAGDSAQQMITYALYSPQGECVQTKSDIVCGEGTHTMAFTVETPALWSCDSPSLYPLVTTFGNQTIKTNIGFRTFEMTPDRGFFLNGKALKIKGVCLHHDLGLLGAAYNRAAARRQLVKMQGMGVNALRTSHNPPASDVMNLCDELGILVVDELFDMWERPKTPFDNARFFLDTYKYDVRSWVRRDRNHPSILMWSIGNEILDTHIDGRGLEITLMLKEEVTKNDPRGNAKITIGSNFMPWEGAQNCASAVDIAGYNYGEKCYEQHHAEHPEWIIYGSETASSLASRGVYRFPIEAPILSDSDMQCSALGNSASSWGTKSMETCLVDDLNTPYSLGQFIWTGTDYIGEPTPYFTRNSYYGQVDTAGYEKDVYYLFQSLWTDAKSNPMIHIGVYWDFNEGQIIDVPVYSNASEVELLLNGNVVGRKKLDPHSIQDCDAKWKLPYQRGILEARGYDEAGNLIAQDMQKSFGCADHIVLTPESTDLSASGEDIAFVEISMADVEGNLVLNANNRVSVKVAGKGRLLGLDNGDSADVDGYHISSRCLFSGKLLAMIGTTKEAGEIVVTASSQGHEDAVLHLHSNETITQEGVSCIRCVSAEPAQQGIPIRKLEIKVMGSTHLNPENPTCEVSVAALPQNATYHDITWAMTNELGIDTPCAKIIQEDGKVYVEAQGDGQIYLRAMTNNGYNHPRIISQMEFSIEGMGIPFIDPYEFVAGGLYDISSGEIGPGNERGASTAHDGWSMFGFTNVNFGDAGADEVTIPVFTVNDEEYPIYIYCGDPREGGETLGTYVYQKPSIWNVYQPITCQLPHPLYGVQTICFALDRKVHVKGFSCTRRVKAYTALPAIRCDRVYGDQFEKTERGIESIGNNVTIAYENMNFEGAESVGLSISGRTSLPSQPVHVRMLNGEGEETSQLVEFAGKTDIITQSFMINALTGICTVSLVFLPGSQFDFYEMQFHRQ